MAIEVNLEDKTNYYNDDQSLIKANKLLRKCKKLLYKRMHLHLRIVLRKGIKEYLNNE